MIKISGALVQPMGDEKMSKCLDTMGNNLLLVFGAVLIVALMFFLAITMIVAGKRSHDAKVGVFIACFYLQAGIKSIIRC